MNDTPQKRPKKKKSRNGPRPKKGKTKKTASEKILVTLSLPQGEVIRIEKLARSGQRHKLSEKEFAALVGRDDVDDLGAALEETYAADVTDAIDDELNGGDELDSFILHEAAGLVVAQRGVRKLMVRKVLRRRMVRKRTHARRAPPHKDTSGQQSPAA